jgi:hypothetical protein
VKPRHDAPGLLRRLWGRRWNALRLALAVFLLWTVASDTSARLARLQLAALPDFDAPAEVRSLRALGRYGEALVIADVVLRDLPEGSPARVALLAEREATLRERDSVLRKLGDAGRGALTGQGDSLEALVGAITADFFVVGDVRDLLVQAGHVARGEDADGVIAALSAAGIATTIAPQIDIAAAVLKAARRAGTLSRELADALIASLRRGGSDEARRLTQDLARLADRASPAGAARLMGLARNQDELATLVRFVEKHDDGAFTLLALGDDGARVVLQGGAEGERLARAAARKGAAGRAFLRSEHAAALLKPHPVLGLLKTAWKGNLSKGVEALLDRALERVDLWAWVIIPLLAGWTLIEGGWLARGIAGGATRGPDSTGHPRSTRPQSPHPTAPPTQPRPGGSFRPPAPTGRRRA